MKRWRSTIVESAHKVRKMERIDRDKSYQLLGGSETVIGINASNIFDLPGEKNKGSIYIKKVLTLIFLTYIN